MGSGKTGQHGATGTFHPGPWEVLEGVSRCLRAPEPTHLDGSDSDRSRSLRGPTLDYGFSLSPSLSFFSFLVRPFTGIFFFFFWYGGFAEKGVTVICPLALQAPLPSTGWGDSVPARTPASCTRS